MVDLLNSKIINLSKKDHSEEIAIKQLLKKSTLKKIVLLSDSSKNKIVGEAPVSLALQSEDSIISGTASNVINCGMQLCTTNITGKVSDEKINKVFELFMLNCGKEPKISLNELKDILKNGAKSVVGKKHLNPEILDSIEHGGNINISLNLNKIVPFNLLFHKIGRNIGYPNLRGNHFLEAQKINLLKKSNLNIKNDGLSFLLHTDSIFTLALNWSYFKRNKMKDISVKMKFLFFITKLLHHFIFNPCFNFIERYQLYFSNKQFQELKRQSKEFKRYHELQSVGMNYAFAHRLILFNNLKSAILDVFGKNTKVDLIWDSSHDSIQKTGDNKWVSRKGVGRKYPFKPIIIGGNKNVNSALCIGKEGDNGLLDSYDHGSGNMKQGIKIDKKTRILRWNKKTKTLKFTKDIFHKKDDGVKKIVKLLEDKDILSQVAELIPMANLKESDLENPHL